MTDAEGTWRREMLSELRAIRAAVEQQHRPRKPSTLSKKDWIIIERLLPGIAGVFMEPFLVRELFRHPSPGLRLLLHGQTTAKIGQLFERAAGIPIGGYTVRRVGSELHTALWRVEQE